MTVFPVITLCGSLRFAQEFSEQAVRLSLAGYIVLAPFVYLPGDQQTSDEKAMLDDMHFTKIDLSDEIYVINVGGYIGASTAREIKYAQDNDKAVTYLEPVR